MSSDQAGPPQLPGQHATQAGLASEELERLARRMQRPPESLQAFARLAPQQMVILHAAVDRACERHGREFDKAPGPALLGPLRRLVLRLLRGREA